MSNFLKLIYNEQIKMYLRKSTWVMYIALALLIIGSGILTMTFDETSKQYDQDTWREVLQAENDELIKEMEEDEFLQDFNSMFIEENNYYLDNDIQPENYGAWALVNDNSILLMLVSLFTIIVAAGIVANEFSWGTIKLLLIRPISRTVILLSKYVSVLLFAFITLLFVLAFSWITGAVLFGVEGVNPYTLKYADNINLTGELHYVPLFKEIIAAYGYQLVNLVMMATLAFMISTVFRSSALAIGVSIFLMMAGNSIVAFVADRTWAKYILFANTNLKQYADGAVFIEGMTMQFSIMMLIIYYVIFMMLAWVFFTKRDIAGQ